MPDLDFEIISADVKPYAAAPTIDFKLRISNAVEGEEVYAAALKTQVRIEAVYRKYDDETKKRLLEVFGKPERWGETLKSLFWKSITIPVPRFTGQTVIEFPLECNEDMTAAIGKYMHSLKDGDIPLAFIFNGSIFYKGAQKNVQVMPLPWEKETSYRLPVSVWNDLMDAYFPEGKWLRVPKNVFDKLYVYKSKSAFPTMNLCLESLIDEGLKKVQNGKEQEL
jgi:hypothetical protein